MADSIACSLLGLLYRLLDSCLSALCFSSFPPRPARARKGAGLIVSPSSQADSGEAGRPDRHPRRASLPIVLLRCWRTASVISLRQVRPLNKERISVSAMSDEGTQ